MNRRTLTPGSWALHSAVASTMTPIQALTVILLDKQACGPLTAQLSEAYSWLSRSHINTTKLHRTSSGVVPHPPTHLICTKKQVPGLLPNMPVTSRKSSLYLQARLVLFSIPYHCSNFSTSKLSEHTHAQNFTISLRKPKLGFERQLSKPEAVSYTAIKWHI